MVRRTIGVRDAKAQLSRLLKDVQWGGEWIITDHGRAVARLVPVPKDDLPLGERIQRLEGQGIIEPPRPSRPLPPPLPLEEGLAQRWLEEERNS